MALDAYNKRLRRRCCDSLWTLCRDVLKYGDMEKKHRDLCEFIESPAKRKFVVGARGVFKTSIGTIARAIQILLINPDARILIVANKVDNAENIVLEIKNFLERNKALRGIMGDQIPEKTSGIRWSKAALDLIRSPDNADKEPSIMAAGVESQLASLHFDYILGDDVVAAGRNDMKEEEKIIVLRPEEVNKAIGWEALNVSGLTIRRRDKTKLMEAQFIVNRWGVHDFANHIKKTDIISKSNPGGYEYLELAAYTDGVLTFPNILNRTDLKRIQKKQGDWMFNTQFLCQPYDPADRGFPPEDNIYWDGLYPPDVDKRRYRIYALMDTADKKNAASCYTACDVVWIDDQNHIWVGEAIRAKLDAPGKIKLIHKLVRQYGLRKFHIEENLHHDMLEFALKDAMKRDKLQYRVVSLKHGNRPKDARIMRLQHHHRCQALHVKKKQTELLEEMRDFPHTHKKDTLDALAYIMDYVKAPLGFGPAPVAVDPEKYTNRMALETLRDRSYGGGLFPAQTRPKIAI